MVKDLLGIVNLVALTVPVVILLAIPLVMAMALRDDARLTRLGAAVLSWSIILFLIGGYGYGALPADYTRDYRLTLRPVANPLGDIHGQELEEAARASGLSNEVRHEKRERVASERRQYNRTWLTFVSLFGFCVIAITLWWQEWSRAKRWA